MNSGVQARAVQWRMLTPGARVWAPQGNYGWRAATVTGLGKNRGERTVVHLAFERGGHGTRYAAQLFWRKVELKGRDKPSPLKRRCPNEADGEAANLPA